jgi:ClpP class serine protease
MEMSKFKDSVKTIQIDFDADVYLFTGAITTDSADTLIQKGLEVKEKAANAVLVLTTNGGDPNAAYRMVRYLKRKYKKLTLYVFGQCKSAGTLIALGADEIVMSEFGELGPLDVQLSKKDELFGRSSGMDIY